MTLGASPHPVADPTGYQRFVLSLLGDDDPAAVQAETPAALREVVEDAGDALRTRPEPNEWCVLECVGHVLDAETVSTARYRWVVAQERPRLIGYDQDLWVTELQHRDDDPEDLLGIFGSLRRWNLDVWERSTPAQRARVGMHEERGPESYELLFKLIAGHDRFHLDQARRALTLVRA